MEGGRRGRRLMEVGEEKDGMREAGRSKLEKIWRDIEEEEEEGG